MGPLRRCFSVSLSNSGRTGSLARNRSEQHLDAGASPQRQDQARISDFACGLRLFAWHTPEIGRRAALDGCPALVREFVDRRMEIDFIGKFAGDGRSVTLRDVVANEVKLESKRIFECFDQERIAGEARFHGETHVIPKWNVVFAALQAVPISTDSIEIRLQSVWKQVSSTIA